MFLMAAALHGDVSGLLRGHWPAASRNLTHTTRRELGGWQPPVFSKLQCVGTGEVDRESGLARTVPANPLQGETEL